MAKPVQLDDGRVVTFANSLAPEFDLLVRVGDDPIMVLGRVVRAQTPGNGRRVFLSRPDGDVIERHSVPDLIRAVFCG